MRLINIDSLALEYFIGGDDDVPTYGILSHTWGADELTLQQFAADGLQAHSGKDGHAKISTCCRLAAQAGLGYVWVDTVCIDKTSSAELTEAINSMFRWYRNAAICYVWLSDLPHGAPVTRMKACRWFTRGWTLQELLAPASVEFYDAEWAMVGTKNDLGREICSITNISEVVLGDPGTMFELSVAQRMSWAASRETTRAEDLAYCLLGIFDVNMPLLYGEGSRAFLRLQEEIARESNDLSLFAWRFEPGHPQAFNGVFAPSPKQFGGSADVENIMESAIGAEYTVTNKGVRLAANTAEMKDGQKLLRLNCMLSRAEGKEVGIWLKAHGGNLYSRVNATSLDSVPEDSKPLMKESQVYLARRISGAYSRRLAGSHAGAVQMRRNFNGVNRAVLYPDFPFEAFRVRPEDDWDPERRRVLTHGAREYFVFFWLRLRPSFARNTPFLGAGMVVVAAGKFGDENVPFVTIMEIEMARKVMGSGQGLESEQLRKARDRVRTERTESSMRLSFRREEGGLTLSVKLEEDVVDGERVSCLDFSAQVVRGSELQR